MPKGSKKRRAERKTKGQKLNNEDVTSCTTYGESEETVLIGETNNNGPKKEPSIPPPYVIVVHGPPKVGKSLLIDSLINYYTSKNHANVGRTIITGSGNRRRIQFVECPNNMNGMIDAAKYADAVMLLIDGKYGFDAKYGFEMETFEFLNLLQVHGVPKVMGVLTYLDKLKDEDRRTTTKTRLIQKFREYIDEGAQIFCLSSFHDNKYHESDIRELADFLLIEEFPILPSRAKHPYMLVDRHEDVPSSSEAHMADNGKRNVILHGYLRGCDIMKGTKVHIAGVGDYHLADVTISADPCSLPPGIHELKIMQINIGENLGDETESFRVGTYLTFKVLGVPFEMVANLDSHQPILVGGISPAEKTVGYMQARLEQHCWQMSSLKTKDPIIVSVGWRRYETVPIYTQDCGGWHKMLEHTPAAESCIATFWGPLAPSGSEVVAVRSLADNKAAFRILARAVVLDYHDVEVRKQIMWTGDLHWKQIKVPHIFNLPTAVLEHRDGVWQSMDSVEKAHVLVIYKNKIAPEPMRTRLIELVGEKLKDDAAKARGNPEQRRAVLTFQAIPATWGSKFRAECVRERLKRFNKKKKMTSMISNV